MSDVIEMRDKEEQETSVLDFLVILAKNKKPLIFVPIFVGVLAAAFSFLLPNIYTANIKLMIPQQGGASTAAAMLSQLGGGALGGLAGGALGLKNPGDLYVGILKSRTISDRLIDQFHLKERYKAKTIIEARERLQKITVVNAGKDGLISLDFEDEDPKFAAAVANAYAQELDTLMQNLAVTEAGRRRLYFEKLLKRAKDELADAEVELRRTQERTGVIEISAQGKAAIEAAATVRAQIASKEVILGTMKSFATDRNPDAIMVAGEIDELRNQLKKLEQPDQQPKRQGDILIPTGKVPEVGVEYTRKLREVKYHEVLFELMAKQYELARADEARDAGTLQVVDRAVPSDRKSKPKRSLILLGAILVSALLTISWVLINDTWKKISAKPENIARLKEIRSLIGFGCGN